MVAAVLPPGGPPDPERTDLFSTPPPGGGGELDPEATGTPDESHADLAIPAQLPTTIARYRIDRELARGGMGQVLAGRDPLLQRDVAIKVLLESHLGKPTYRRRFREEARITGALQHPGIVPVYELGDLTDSRPFFAMQLVNGQTLDALLADRKNPTEELPRFLQAFERVCQAIAYAHSVGVIHRDLKPLNIMIAPFGVVKVMDWGLARALDGAELTAEREPPEESAAEQAALDPTEDTRVGNVFGTPAYMAPEQAHGDTALLDRRTDVFGLGGILCAILTGQPPYPGKGTRQVYAQAVRADLAEAYARLDASPAARELVTLAKACLAADPTARPADASEVVAALTAYLESDLRRAERDLVRFFEFTLDLCCIAGTEGYFRRVNENFTRVLGYAPGVLLSRPWLDFVHPEDREATIAAGEQLTRGLPVVQFRNRYRDVRGGYRWFEWAAKSIPEEGIIFAVARDITDRVELELRSRSLPDGTA